MHACQRCSEQGPLTEGAREAMPLLLFVEQHLTAGLLQHILLCPLHQAEGASPALPHSVHLRLHLSVVHQRGHAQEPGDKLKKNLNKTIQKHLDSQV